MATSIAMIGPHPESLPRLASISPKMGPRYSANLYRWMRRLKPLQLEQAAAYRNASTGLIYIGYHAEILSKWFSGAMLNRIMIGGTNAKMYSYPNHGFELIPGFWPEYVRIGRCHIDPEHEQYFLGDKSRWVYDNEDQRRCAWCGECRQVRTQEQVVKTVEAWKTLSDQG